MIASKKCKICGTEMIDQAPFLSFLCITCRKLYEKTESIEMQGMHEIEEKIKPDGFNVIESIIQKLKCKIEEIRAEISEFETYRSGLQYSVNLLESAMNEFNGVSIDDK